MATAKIIPIGMGEIELISELYNDIFSPAQDIEFLQRRFLGKHNVCMIVAMLDDRHIGFATGFEIMPTTFFCWLIGVHPDFHREGIATQLVHGIHAWAKDENYQMIRFECQNQHRPMLHLAISEGYDLVGMRWDTATANNVAIFEKDLR